VVISAILIQPSISNQVYRTVITDHSLLISVEIELELVKTIKHRKFLKYFRSEAIREELILSFLSTCSTIPVHHKLEICRDEKNNKFLELALSGDADIIISGDKDLLVLSPFEKIPIVSPSDFLSKY